MNKLRRLLYVLPLTAALVLTSCFPECKDCDFDVVVPRVSRVMFSYLAMDEKFISSYGERNISDMVAGATRENIGDGVIYVFQDRYNQPSRLLRISAGADGDGKLEEVIVYEENLDASDPEVLKMAFADVRARVASDSWVMTIGTHGMGWMPAALHGSIGRLGGRSMLQPYGIMDAEYEDTSMGTRAFMRNADDWMEVADFVAALPGDIKFEVILVDACLMGCAEFAYLLKDKAENLVVSAAEVLMMGMPYHKIIGHLFASTPKLGSDGVCEEYINFYLTDTERLDDNNRFATVAHIKCSEMDGFADMMAEILAPNKEKLALMAADDLAELQTLDRYHTQTFFDLGTLVNALYPEDLTVLDTFAATLGKLIPYKRSTEKPLNRFVVPDDAFCGLSIYVPTITTPVYSNLTNAYWDTAWAQRVYGLE